MRRRLLTPSFHFQILNTFIEVFNKQSLILCNVLDKRRKNQQEDEIINVYPFVANCTLDIICGKRYFLEIAIIPLFKNITKCYFRGRYGSFGECAIPAFTLRQSYLQVRRMLERN